MKIGIFGDSFAHNRSDNPTLSWPQILAKKYEVENFSEPGSSLYFSVSELIKYHEQFDKIIFTVTTPGRLLLQDEINPRKKFIPNYHNAVIKKQMFNNDHKMIKIINAAMDYFLYIKNDEFDRFIHNLLIDEIEKIRPDTIIIPSFKESLKTDKVSMFNIQWKENLAWDYMPEVASFTDRRNCHLTEENNLIFASKVEEWLNGEPVIIRLSDYVTPMNKEFYLL